MVHGFLLLLSALFVLSTGANPGNINGSIAAVVNNKVITVKDLNDRVALTLLGAQRAPNDEERHAIEQKVIRQLIEEELQRQETKMFDIAATEEEIQQQLAAIEKNNGLPSGALLKKLNENNIPWETLKTQISTNIAWSKLIMHMRSMAKVGKEAVRAQAQQQNRRDQDRYLLAEIALPFSSLAGALQTEQVAHQVVQEIQGGKPFNMVAMEVSQSPSAALGGDIDWVDADQLPQEVRIALENMPVGTLSQPIRTDHSYRILLLRGKHDASRTQQKVSLRQIHLPFPPTMDANQKNAEVEKARAALKDVHDCTAFERAAEIIEGATLQIHQSISPDQLSGGLDQIIETLPLNTVSDPLPVNDASVMFFMVCDRTTVQNDVIVQEKMEEIEQELAHKKLASIASKRLQNMHRRAFIDVRI